MTADRKPDKQPAASPGQKAQHDQPEHDYGSQLDESLTTEMGGTSRATNAQVESSMEVDEQ